MLYAHPTGAKTGQFLLAVLLDSQKYNPHAILGLHPFEEGKKVIRIWRPGAHSVFLEVKGCCVEAYSMDGLGLFEYVVSSDIEPYDYRIYHTSGLLAHDPYAFLPTFETLDQYLFSQGVHYNLHRQMGARLTEHQGCQGVKFSVWAPNACQVSLVGDFNHWDGRVNPMRSLGTCGVWELFIPGLQLGEKYKFEIYTKQGERKLKTDPYALYYELRPSTAALVADIDRYSWKDTEWMQARARSNLDKPVTIYEVHLGSWRKHYGQFLNYQEIANHLASYCQEMGFTHVELLPIAEHPLDESWGYQVTGFFAPTSRFGSPEDFQIFVDTLHQAGIGVILDWVPGHFPKDDFSLAYFDGTALYEHHDTKEGYHPHWHTHIFNLGRKEVSNFLIASALFWLDVMHIDGLRVDAVASMLYRDYGREEGQWVPNIYGGKENLETIEFFKHVNSLVHHRFPGVWMIAEESTAFRGVSHSLEEGGLGFDMKWNMGWMNDSLRYIAKDPLYRKHHHNDLTFGLLYAFNERFTLVLSHDEVVHGKKSLLSRMPGDIWQKFANLRLLYSYMISQPGKKLLFMGAEIGQWNEWDCKGELEWFLLDFPLHRGLKQMVQEINHFYLKTNSLWKTDFHYSGFEWVDFQDATNSVISYRRRANCYHGEQEEILCVHNFTPTYHPRYFIHQRGLRSVEEVFNSDEERFGGSGKAGLPASIHYDATGYPVGIEISLAPLATLFFRIQWV